MSDFPLMKNQRSIIILLIPVHVYPSIQPWPSLLVVGLPSSQQDGRLLPPSQRRYRQLLHGLSGLVHVLPRHGSMQVSAWVGGEMKKKWSETSPFQAILGAPELPRINAESLIIIK